MAARLLLVLVLGTALVLPSTSAEIVDKHPLTLAELATHIVVGRVIQICPDEKRRMGARQTQECSAEIVVLGLEKGGGLSPGDIMFGRLWTASSDVPMTDSAGHRGIPKPYDWVRVYLVMECPEGEAQSGECAYNVILPNGFEVLDDFE